MDALSADLVSLALLPFRWRLRIASQLRAGRTPTEILDELVPELEDAGRDIGAAAARALTDAAAADVRPIGWNDPDYPPALAAIADPPPVLWLKGRVGALIPPAVAVVGSRAGSSYALSVAERLGEDLAARGVCVVSGMARGVDSAAHRGALRAGPTIAVLGSGPDVVYPAEHRKLAADICGSGAIVSELPPRTPPRPAFFPRRNRIISGIVRGVVVVEAGEKSGSLITARCALEQGRDVLAVPGNVLTGRNAGGHALLRDGATLVETADDIMEELGLAGQGSAVPAAASNQTSRRGAYDPVLASLPRGEACSLDEIADRSGLGPGRLLPRLFELELQGVVRRAGGGRFIRI